MERCESNIVLTGQKICELAVEECGLLAMVIAKILGAPRANQLAVKGSEWCGCGDVKRNPEED
jgi:hypothetical protein